MVLCPQKLKGKDRDRTNSGSLNENSNNKDNCKQCVKNRKEKLSPKHSKPNPIPTSNSNHLLPSPAGSYQTSSHPGTPMSPITQPGKFRFVTIEINMFMFRPQKLTQTFCLFFIMSQISKKKYQQSR